MYKTVRIRFSYQYLDNLNDKFCVSFNLKIEILERQISLHFLEKIGLCNLYELQKLKNPFNSRELIDIYIDYLLEIRATFSALFLLKNRNFYTNHAAKITLENAISLGAKVHKHFLNI